MAYTAGQKLRAADLARDLDTGTAAQYGSAATQTIATGTQPIVAFATANRTSTLITRTASGAGHKFDCGRAGLWAVSFTIRYNGATTTTGERYALLNSDAGGLAATSGLMGTFSGPMTLHASGVFFLASGVDVWVETFQNSGGNRDLEVNNTIGWGRIELAWLHA